MLLVQSGLDSYENGVTALFRMRTCKCAYFCVFLRVCPHRASVNVISCVLYYASDSHFRLRHSLLVGLKQLTMSATRDFVNQRYPTYEDFTAQADLMNASYVRLRDAVVNCIDSVAHRLLVSL